MQDYSKEFDQKIMEYKKSLLKPILEQCTDGQKDMFARMYTNIDSMKEVSMRHAYGQIKRSLSNNKNKEEI